MAPKVAKADNAKAGKKRVSRQKMEGGDGGVKKTPSAYIIFCSERRSEVKDQNPDASFGELGKLLGKIWASMSEEEKEAYKEKQAERKAAAEIAVEHE
eukprot:gene18615-37617_t